MLQPAISTSEDSGEVFVCVMVAQTSPVLEDLRLRIGTVDGTAVGNLFFYMEREREKEERERERERKRRERERGRGRKREREC